MIFIKTPFLEKRLKPNEKKAGNRVAPRSTVSVFGIIQFLNRSSMD